MSPAPTLPTPLYARRDIEDLCEYYTRHLDAMTREKLHSKSEIAAELGWRDRELTRALEVAITARELKEQAGRLAGALELWGEYEFAMGKAGAALIDKDIPDEVCDDLRDKADEAYEAFTEARRKELAAWKEGRA